MKTYAYSVHTQVAADTRVVYETDNLRNAIVAFLKAIGCDHQVDLTHNSTGNVLAIHSDTEDYCAESLLLPMAIEACGLLTEE